MNMREREKEGERETEREREREREREKERERERVYGAYERHKNAPLRTKKGEKEKIYTGP